MPSCDLQTGRLPALASQNARTEFRILRVEITVIEYILPEAEKSSL